jgi:hypothetical protein
MVFVELFQAFNVIFQNKLGTRTRTTSLRCVIYTKKKRKKKPSLQIDHFVINIFGRFKPEFLSTMKLLLRGAKQIVQVSNVTKLFLFFSR